MREFVTDGYPGTEKKGPRVYGDIRYQNVWVNPHERGRIEKQLIHWILAKNPRSTPAEEIQYWVTFRRDEPEFGTTCRVEIFGPAKSWESLESAPVPYAAFERCMGDLSPMPLSTV